MQQIMQSGPTSPAELLEAGPEDKRWGAATGKTHAAHLFQVFQQRLAIKLALAGGAQALPTFNRQKLIKCDARE